VTVNKNNKEKEAIMSTYHEEPIQGGHTGISKTLAKVYVSRHKRVHKKISQRPKV